MVLLDLVASTFGGGGSASGVPTVCPECWASGTFAVDAFLTRCNLCGYIQPSTPMRYVLPPSPRLPRSKLKIWSASRREDPDYLLPRPHRHAAAQAQSHGTEHLGAPSARAVTADCHAALRPLPVESDSDGAARGASPCHPPSVVRASSTVAALAAPRACAQSQSARGGDGRDARLLSGRLPVQPSAGRPPNAARALLVAPLPAELGARLAFVQAFRHSAREDAMQISSRLHQRLRTTAGVRPLPLATITGALCPPLDASDAQCQTLPTAATTAAATLAAHAWEHHQFQSRMHAMHSVAGPASEVRTPLSSKHRHLGQSNDRQESERGVPRAARAHFERSLCERAPWTVEPGP